MDVASHPFPLIRAGGAFLMVAGAIFAVGWVKPRWFTALTIAAFSIGGIAAWAGPQLYGPDFGPGPLLHYAVLGGAIFVEAAAIIWLYRSVKDERRADAWMLMIVALHFAPMAVLLGPLGLTLAAALAANAAAALAAPQTPILRFGLIDSAIKVGCGVAMFFAYPTWMEWLRLAP